VLLLLLATVPMLTKIFTSDYGTHLALGRFVVEQREIPTREHWNYPSLGMENASGGEWGFQAILYLVRSAGGEYGVSLFLWLMVLAIFLFLHRSAVLRGADPLIAALALFAFAGFLRIRVQPRPEMFTYLFISFTIWLLSEYYFGRRKRGIWTLPVLVLIWANCHPTYLMVFLLMGAFFADALARAAWSREIRLERMKGWVPPPVIVGVLGVFLCGLNPYGYIRLLEPLHLISRGEATVQSSVLVSISELTPVWQTGMYTYYKVAAAFAAVSFLMGTVGKRIYLLDLFLFGIAFKGSWDSARAVSMIGLFLSPGVSLHLTGFREFLRNHYAAKAHPSIAEPAPRRKKGGKGAKKEREAFLPETFPESRGKGFGRRIPAAITAVLLLSMLLFGSANLAYSFGQLQWGVGITEHKFSFKAAEFLRKNPVPGRMFNFFDVGGFLDWQLHPETLTFIDGRTYNRDVFMEHQFVTSAQEGWELVIEKYGITYAVLKTIDSSGIVLPLVPALSNASDWGLVFADGLFVVFVRVTPQTD
jgi:hypothetical protein